MKIRTKILSGYLVIAMATFIISAINYSHFYLLNQKYNLSEQLATNVKIMDQIVEKVWETRFFINQFIFKHEHDDNQQSLKSLSKLQKLIVDIGIQEMDEERLNLFNQIHELIIPYQKNYIKLAKLINRFDLEKQKFSGLIQNIQKTADSMVLLPMPSDNSRNNLIKAHQKLLVYTQKNSFPNSQNDNIIADKMYKIIESVEKIMINYQKQNIGTNQIFQSEWRQIFNNVSRLKVISLKIKKDTNNIDHIIKKDILPIAPEIGKIARLINKSYWHEEENIRLKINENFKFDLTQVFIISAISLILSILFGLLFSRRITNPIISLSQSAVKLAKGNLDGDLVYDSNDEMGNLTKSFNQMKEAIQLKIEDLKTLNIAGQKLVTAKKGEEILETVVDLMKKKTQVLGGIIHFCGDDSCLESEYITQQDFDAQQDLTLLMEEIIQQSISLNKIIFIENAANEDTLIKELPFSFLVAPLQYQGKTAGTLLLYGDPAIIDYNESDNEFILAVSRLTISAVKNVNMLELIEEKNISLIKANYTKDKLLSKMKRMNVNLESVVKERTIKLSAALDNVQTSNQKLLSSIEYAKRIQSSLLPEIKHIQEQIPESFFIWQPRDIVGGDMYFTTFFENGYILSIIDCTGHGVPGAFMTMLASSGLKGIIKDDDIKDPSEILRRLNVFIKTALHQHTGNALSDDGLEAAICYVNQPDNTLTFASAGIPLIQVENNQIDVIKGNRKNIGYKRSTMDSHFDNTVISLSSDMSFYLYTDGVTDQLGGPKRIHFGKKRLHNLLLQVSNRPFEVQQGMILNAFQTFQAKNDRLDDVTIIGFKPLSKTD
ncbi:MAG: SpoIIE family protein phosphatase [Deltaproteobacteria bacterium]|nr:SpoIIE family protein phosphatase [Deltaproteobacteria bacterium]MBT4526924.1 SpoIIE family protein phosphatase [Deltaproteobacteria bacterium]